MSARLVLLPLLLGACGGDLTRPDSCDLPAPEVPACERVARLVPLRQVTHPGGAELDVRLFDDCGRVLPSSYAACIEPGEGAAAAPRTYARGLTLLLVAAPASERDAAAAVAVVERILAARPAAERIAVFRWGAEIAPISDLTLDRPRIRRLVAEALSAGDAGAPLAAADALERAGALVEAAEGAAELLLRAVVVVGPDRPPEAPQDRVAVVASAHAGADPDGAAASASAVLDAAARAGAAGIGACGRDEVTLRVPAAGLERRVALAAPLAEEAALPCDPAAAARGERVYPRRIEFVLTPAQRAFFDETHALRSRRDFTVSIKVGDAAPTPGHAHLRGHGTMLCERKSYSVNLAGTEPRHILPGSATDELYVISLCWDQAYVESHTAYQLLAARDLFPFRFGYVELLVDGVSQGVHLLVEKPHEELRLDHGRPLAVVRRNHEGEGDPLDVKSFVDDVRPVLEAYEALVTTARALQGDELVAELRRRMALDHFLRWVATMTALHNSDYGDEVRFLATERLGGGAFFSVTAWDPEDILRLDCVWEQYAFYDPWGLVWCAEGELENALLGDAAAYALYVDELEAVLDTLAVEDLDAASAATRASLLPLLADPDVRAASIEMGSPESVELAAAEVDRRLRIMRSRFVSWRAELSGRIAAYRAATGRSR